jgi:hypothetical protein
MRIPDQGETTMKPARALFVLTTAILTVGVLTACRMDVDEMVMNPTTRDEIITKLLEENVSKQNIMDRLTTGEDTKMELAETLLGDMKVKTLALDKLTADGGQRQKIVDKLMTDDAAKTALITALLGDAAARTQIQDALKKPLPKKQP